jgi:hypothetical protein
LGHSRDLREPGHPLSTVVTITHAFDRCQRASTNWKSASHATAYTTTCVAHTHASGSEQSRRSGGHGAGLTSAWLMRSICAGRAPISRSHAGYECTRLAASCSSAALWPTVSCDVGPAAWSSGRGVSSRSSLAGVRTANEADGRPIGHSSIATSTSTRQRSSSRPS